MAQEKTDQQSRKKSDKNASLSKTGSKTGKEKNASRQKLTQKSTQKSTRPFVAAHPPQAVSDAVIVANVAPATVSGAKKNKSDTDPAKKASQASSSSSSAANTAFAKAWTGSGQKRKLLLVALFFVVLLGAIWGGMNYIHNTSQTVSQTANADLQAGIEDLQSRMAQMIRGQEESQHIAQEAIARAAQEAGQQIAQNAALARNTENILKQRIAVLETNQSRLTERLIQIERRGGAFAARVIALANLARSIRDSRPFKNELVGARESGVLLVPVPVLEKQAAQGLASLLQLQTGLPKAIRAALRAEKIAASEGWLARAVSSLGAMITIRPLGAVEGDDLQSILARLENFLVMGDLGQALVEAESLSPAAKEAMASWLMLARARAQGLRELTRLEDELLSFSSSQPLLAP